MNLINPYRTSDTVNNNHFSKTTMNICENRQIYLRSKVLLRTNDVYLRDYSTENILFV